MRVLAGGDRPGVTASGSLSETVRRGGEHSFAASSSSRLPCATRWGLSHLTAGRKRPPAAANPCPEVRP